MPPRLQPAQAGYSGPTTRHQSRAGTLENEDNDSTTLQSTENAPTPVEPTTTSGDSDQPGPSTTQDKGKGRATYSSSRVSFSAAEPSLTPRLRTLPIDLRRSLAYRTTNPMYPSHYDFPNIEAFCNNFQNPTELRNLGNLIYDWIEADSRYERNQRELEEAISIQDVRQHPDYALALRKYRKHKEENSELRERLSQRERELQELQLQLQGNPRTRSSLRPAQRDFSDSEEEQDPRPQYTVRVGRSSSQASSGASTVRMVAPSNYRPRGRDPKDKFDGTPEKYAAWRYEVDQKLEDDAPLYDTDKRAISYALSQLDSSLFDSLRAWFTQSNYAATLSAFFEEVEFFAGVNNMKEQALQELRSIKQNPGENVTQYFNRLSQLWTRASTPLDERSRQLLVTCRPSLTLGMRSRHYSNPRQVLEDLRRSEEAQLAIDSYYPRRERVAGAAKPREATTSTATTKTKKTTTVSERKWAPTATKPAWWTKAWYEPMDNPPKLTNGDREQLNKQGRCWSCRGSGHIGTDSCCPKNAPRKVSAIIQELPSDSSDEELKE